MRNDTLFSTVEAYWAAQPSQTLPRLLELRAFILEVAPQAEERINYNIPAYALVPGGKRDQQILIAGYARHVGFYPSPAVISHFAQELAGYEQGKGSVQFSIQDALPRDLILRMVRYRMERLEKEGK
ncbi:MAG: DUF1801 domain-containing protein [Bacteroidetes bacterium]|nr:MAG: DUF1801 domain-containing protein [Bacteroidota bacterium]